MIYASIQKIHNLIALCHILVFFAYCLININVSLLNRKNHNGTTDFFPNKEIIIKEPKAIFTSIFGYEIQTI